MTVTATPTASSSTPEEATARVEGIRPVIEENSGWMEENRRLHPEVAEALHDGGLFKLRVAPHLGGGGESYKEIYRIVSDLASVDGSTAWTVAVSSITSWMASHLPDQVQDEVFSGRTQTCGTLSPTGTLAPSSDESILTLDGSWKFISGALTSDWQVVIAMTPPGFFADEPVPAYAVVPLADLKVIDDWNTTGLRGTGSVTTAADSVAVPVERVAPLPPLLEGQGASDRLAQDPRFSDPLIPTASALSVSVAPGLAGALVADFTETSIQRPVTYTDYTARSESPVIQLQLAEATHLVDEAGFQALSLASTLDAADGQDAGYWSMDERILARARLGRATDLSLKAGRLIGDASGGSSIYLDSSGQQGLRDLHAMSLHALISPATNGELFGRSLVGLEPTTLYV